MSPSRDRSADAPQSRRPITTMVVWHFALSVALFQSAPVTLPRAAIRRVALSPILCDTPAADGPADKSPAGPVDKQLSNEKLIRFSSISDEFIPLVNNALARLDRNRVLQGKPKYETIDGMIDAYVEESAKAGLNWTRDEAEREVTRYMMRQALADEGGIGNGGKGDGQDRAAFALLALLIASVGYQTAGGQMPDLPQIRDGGLELNPFF